MQTIRQHGLKHSIECNCILPLYRGRNPPFFHRFVVFSVVNDDDTVIVKHVSCNNCGVTHRVFEVGKSEIVSDENTSLVRSIDDVALSVPDRLAAVLHEYKAPFPLWEECEFTMRQRRPKAAIILTRETLDDKTHGKMLRINGKNSFEIEQYETSDVF